MLGLVGITTGFVEFLLHQIIMTSILYFMLDWIGTGG